MVRPKTPTAVSRLPRDFFGGMPRQAGLRKKHVGSGVTLERALRTSLARLSLQADVYLRDTLTTSGVGDDECDGDGAFDRTRLVDEDVDRLVSPARPVLAPALCERVRPQLAELLEERIRTKDAEQRHYMRMPPIAARSLRDFFCAPDEEDAVVVVVSDAAVRNLTYIIAYADPEADVEELSGGDFTEAWLMRSAANRLFNIAVDEVGIVEAHHVVAAWLNVFKVHLARVEASDPELLEAQQTARDVLRTRREEWEVMKQRLAGQTTSSAFECDDYDCWAEDGGGERGERGEEAAAEAAAEAANDDDDDDDDDEWVDGGGGEAAAAAAKRATPADVAPAPAPPQ